MGTLTHKLMYYVGPISCLDTLVVVRARLYLSNSEINSTQQFIDNVYSKEPGVLISHSEEETTENWQSLHKFVSKRIQLIVWMENQGIGLVCFWPDASLNIPCSLKVSEHFK